MLNEFHLLAPLSSIETSFYFAVQRNKTCNLSWYEWHVSRQFSIQNFCQESFYEYDLPKISSPQPFFSQSKSPTQNPKLSAQNRLKSILSKKFSFKMGSRSKGWTTPKAENNPDPYKAPSRSSSVVHSKIPKWPQKGLRMKSNPHKPNEKERRRSMVFVHGIVGRVSGVLKRPGGGNNQSKSPLIIPTQRDRQQPETEETEEFSSLAKNGLRSHQVIPKRTSAPFQPQDPAIYPSLRYDDCRFFLSISAVGSFNPRSHHLTLYSWNLSNPTNPFWGCMWLLWGVVFVTTTLISYKFSHGFLAKQLEGGCKSDWFTGWLSTKPCTNYI